MASRRRLGLVLATVGALVILHVAACSSSSDPTPTVPTNQTHDSGQQVVETEDSAPPPAYDSSGAMTVNCGGEICVKGDICIKDEVDGGQPVQPQGGNCPGTLVLDDAGNLCVSVTSYHCKGLPAACSGTPSCSCAGFQCAPSTTCQSVSGFTLTCSG
jgi:hypothetical protein